MKVRLLIVSLLWVFSLVYAASFDPEVTGSKTFFYVAKIPFQAKILPVSSDLTEESEGMKQSFLAAYTPFSAEFLFGEEQTKALGGSRVAKEKALEEAFKEEIGVLGTTGISHVRLETAEHNLIGFFSVENWDIYKESPTGFPAHSIYVRQFYVLPSFQRHGIGRIAMSTLLKDLNPSAQHIYIATRRINEGAKTLYEGLGFEERSEALHGLSPEKYISYELHLNP